MKKAFFVILLLSILLWLGIPTAQEAMKTHDGIRCQENIRYIEDGKKHYISSLSYLDENGRPTAPQNPARYMDLIPYMPLKNIPECPCGKPYLNVLDLSETTTCQVNGEPEYETTTLGTNPLTNGFHDGYATAEHVPWWRIPLRMLGLENTKTPFQTTPTETPQ